MAIKEEKKGGKEWSVLKELYNHNCFDFWW